MATFFRVRQTLTLPGVSTPPLITTYWDSTGAAGAALVTEAMARVRAFFLATASDVPVNAALVYNAVADEIEETTGQIVGQQAGTAPAASVYTGGGDLLPLQTQALVRFMTSTFIAGRKLQGRMFVPFAPESDNDSGGRLQATYVTRLQNAANALGTTIVTPMNQRVWSRPQPGRAGLSAPVIARTVSPDWSVLRSRRS